jgi:hypothetical protein
MTKKLGIIAGSLLVASSFVSAVRAETSVGITNINVTATVPGVNTLTAEVRNLSDNALVTDLAFGSVPSSVGVWSSQPGQHVVLAVDDNSVSWRLRTYTKNFATAPSTTTWGATFGGLIGAVAGSKIPMGWLNNPTSLAPGGPGLGDPANGTTNGWTFFKDSFEGDFVSADAGGYTNIAFGGAAFTNIVRPNLPAGSEGLTPRTTPWFFYVEGSFNNAPSTSYTSTLVLELLNQ